MSIAFVEFSGQRGIFAISSNRIVYWYTVDSQSNWAEVQTAWNVSNTRRYRNKEIQFFPSDIVGEESIIVIRNTARFKVIVRLSGFYGYAIPKLFQLGWCQRGTRQNRTEQPRQP